MFHKHHFQPVVSGSYTFQKGKREIQVIRDGVLEVCWCTKDKQVVRIPDNALVEVERVE